jgi:hypothetical protein
MSFSYKNRRLTLPLKRAFFDTPTGGRGRFAFDMGYNLLYVLCHGVSL